MFERFAWMVCMREKLFAFFVGFEAVIQPIVEVHWQNARHLEVGIDVKRIHENAYTHNERKSKYTPSHNDDDDDGAST